MLGIEHLRRPWNREDEQQRDAIPDRKRQRQKRVIRDALERLWDVLEDDVAVGADFVVDADVGGEGGAAGGDGVADVGEGVDAEAFGVGGAVDLHGDAVTGEVRS